MQTMKFDEMSEKFSRKVGRQLSLGGLRCFEAAAHKESFTQAAISLSLTHGAVSRAVRVLEDELGVALFERRHRRVFLTDAGRKLYQAAQQAFAILEQTAQELYLQAQEAPIVLSCEPTLLMRWLIPRLPVFQRALPDVNLQLVAGGGPFSFRDGITVAIRRNDVAREGHMQITPLFVEKIGPVCKPEMSTKFIEGSGTNIRIRDDALLLHTLTRPHAWSDWAKSQGVSLTKQPQQYFDHFYFSLQAAVAGMGMSMAPWQHVRDDIATGLLTAPFGFQQNGSGYCLLTKHKVVSGSPLDRVIAWLQANAET